MFFNRNIGQKKQNAGDEVIENDQFYQKGVATVRGLIAPSALQVQADHLQIGGVLSTTIFVVAYPRFLNDNWFSPIINIDFPMDISMFIHPADTRDVLQNLKKSAAHVHSQINIEAESGKVSDPMLETAVENIESLRISLQQGTERFFRFGLYATIYADDKNTLQRRKSEIEAILEAQLIYVKPAILRMEQGLASTIPLGNDRLNAGNNLNTAPLSTTFPFVSADLSSNEGILYGINRHNNSLILFDRFNMENANMVVFAKSGGGKSYFVKLELLRSLMLGIHVIVIDPESEYKHLCQTVGGTFVRISLGSNAHINPFELPRIPKDERPVDVFRNTIASLIGLLHIMLGSVTPEEDTVLERAIREAYAVRDIVENSRFGNIPHSGYPTMTDLYEVLRSMDGGDSLAKRLSKYTEGIFSGFLNNATNIEINNQMVVFNIRDLEEELRPIAMYMVLQFIWNEMRSNMTRRVVAVDEAWVMMQNDDAAAFMFGIAKRCRKYYTGLTTITQDVTDFMTSRYGKPIVTNSSLQLLLRQSPASVDVIAETFFLTDHERFLLLESNVGEGILFAGPKHAAIKVIASYSEDQIITSDPRQLEEIERAKEEMEHEGD
ncbi:MAG: ATP-binding protein [Parcubacteria group bacterium]|jgi:type IV secretory pathway VirB4 component